MQLAGTPFLTATGGDGRFRFEGVPAGVYLLQATTVGYYLVKQPFTLAAGERKEFEIVLTPSSLRQSESVEVRAEPFDFQGRSGPAELDLTATEVKNLGSVLADDPIRSVQALPGVTSNDDFRSEFSMRAAGFDRIGLYFDEILLHSPFHAVEGVASSGSLTIFNGDMIDTVTLHEGAYPARYADRTAGALDVATREGNRRTVSFRVLASASNLGGIAEGPLGRSHRGSWLAGARKSYLQYIIQRTSDDPTLAFGFTDGQARLTYDLTPKHTVNLSLVDGASGLDRTEAASRLGGNSVMTSGYHFTVVNLSSRYAPNSRFVVVNRAAYLRERASNRNPESLELSGGGYGEWIWNLSANWAWSEANPLQFGASARRLRDDGFSNNYQFNPFAVRRLDAWRGSAVLAGGWAEQSRSFASGRLVLAAGVRWDRHGVSPRAVVSPRASAALALSPSTRLSFGWGQYTQFPQLSQFYSLWGAAWLLPERSTHYEASIEQRLGPRARLRIGAYNRLDRDLLFRSLFEPRLVDGRIFNPPADAALRNAVRGYARGAQIFFQRRTANGFTGWVSYALGYSRLRDGTAGVTYPSDYDQRHTVNVFASYRLRPTVNLSARWLYGSGFPVPGYFREAAPRSYFLAAARNNARIGAYQRVDFRINKVFVYDRWKLTLFGEVINLLNRDNRRFDSFNGYNSRTGQARITFNNMIPILPSAGVALEF